MLSSVIIADACPIMAEGLERILASTGQIRIVHICHSCTQLMEHLSSKKPDILLLHPELDPSSDYLLSQKIRKKYPQLKILSFSETNNPFKIKQLFHIGIQGFLLRTAKREELVAAIDSVTDSKLYIQEEIKNRITDYSLGLGSRKKQNTALTRREIEVLQLIIEEYTTKEIAKELFISEDTVETHRAHLIRKLDVKNTAGLVRTAILKGILPLSLKQ